MRSNPKPRLSEVEVEELSRREWRQRYAETDYGLDEDAPFTPALASALEPLAGKSILDIGCGSGRAIPLLARGGNRVFGFDIAHAALKRSKVSMPDANVFVADADVIPLPSRSVDFVFCWRVLHNLTRRQSKKALAEIYRVLVSSGAALFSIASISSSKIDFYTRQGYRLEEDPDAFVIDNRDLYRFKRFYSEQAALDELEPLFNIQMLDQATETPGTTAFRETGGVNAYWTILAQPKA